MIPLRILVPTSVAIAALAVACTRAEPAAATKVELPVAGMTCSGCEKSIAAAVAALPGVRSCAPDHARGRVAVEFDAAQVDRARIAATIRAAGYETPEETPK